MTMLKDGIIDRAYFAGTDNPGKYHRRYPRTRWGSAGGYRIQTTPQELSMVVAQVRSLLHGKRMLCVGYQTAGAERFLAENCGILETHFLGEPKSPVAEANIKAIGGKIVSKPDGDYSLVVLFGDSKPDYSLLRDNGFMVFIGIGTQENPKLRAEWMKARRAHRPDLQTGSLPFQTGVGVVMVKKPKVEVNDAVQESEAKSVDVREQAGDGEGVGAGNEEKEAPKAGEEKAGKDDPEAPVKKWSRAHDKCIECGTTDKKHISKGLCQTCYPKRK